MLRIFATLKFTTTSMVSIWQISNYECWINSQFQSIGMLVGSLDPVWNKCLESITRLLVSDLLMTDCYKVDYNVMPFPSPTATF